MGRLKHHVKHARAAVLLTSSLTSSLAGLARWRPPPSSPSPRVTVGCSHRALATKRDVWLPAAGGGDGAFLCSQSP